LQFETDPIFSASPAANIANTQILRWDDAHGWGDHNAEGYLLSADLQPALHSLALLENYDGGAAGDTFSNYVLDGGNSSAVGTGIDGGNAGFDVIDAYTKSEADGIFLTAHQDITSKADITYVDAADALKADISYVDAQDALKADTTYVDAQDALKADVATTLAGYGITDAYTVAEVDSAIAAANVYNDAAVDAHINQSSATTNQVLSWDGADYTWVDPAGVDLTGYATETYVSTEISNLVASAPGTLDTLNELADALGDDPNFATTVTNSIATKLSTAGGTMTGPLTLAGVVEDITSLGNKSGASAIDPRNSTVFPMTLTGDYTFTGFIPATAGQNATLIITQDAGGNNTWNTSGITAKYSNGDSTLSTASNSVDIMNIFYDGSTYFCSLTKGYS
jgi:hypothetical protein